MAPGQDRFAQDKDEGVLRIFVLGASTLLGFPNPAKTSFPNFLQLMLEDAYPGREIEVINCGITAINITARLCRTGRRARAGSGADLRGA